MNRPSRSFLKNGNREFSMQRGLIIYAAVWAFWCGASIPAFAQETTWLYPPVSTQLEMDDTLVPIGKGAIFCPAMTDPDNEPVYGVLRDGRRVEDAKMGKRIPLEPGIYTVVIGSGTIDQLMQKRVRVEEGATTVIKADWSGLVIDVISESRTPVREYYELFSLDTGVSYGLGQGAEEGLDEKIITWVLPPGRYKVVKPGDNINAVLNFGTIRLMPGELVQTNLVIDSTTGNFRGFGYLSDIAQAGRRSNVWEVRSELSGNVLLNYVPTSEAGTESDASFTSTAQWLTDARYENGNHVIPVWSNIEEGLSMENDRVLRKYIDKAELRLTYIYHFTDIASPYIRVSGETRFFSTYQRFKDPTDYVETDAHGDTLDMITAADEVKLGKPFAPVYLKTGAGFNSILVKSLPVNFNLRSGYGFRRTFARGAKNYNSNTKVLSGLIETETTGMEFLLLGDIRIGKYIIFTNDFDLLVPGNNRDEWIYDGENRLRLNLTSNVSLLFTMEYWKDENVKKTQFRYQTLLRFSKYL
jgi:hypothetical protein